MSSKTPLRIGLSACFFHADPQRPVFKGKTLQYAEQSIVRWIQSEGPLVYMVPSVKAEGSLRLEQYAQDLDGLVLQGGSDVSPSSYGETPLKPEWSGDKIRDDYEIALVKEFTKLGKPVLGVCRGLQLLNVAFGGSLYQDITTQVSGSLQHRNWDIYDFNQHEIHFENDSRIAQWNELKPPFQAKVNSVHHQGIKELGKNLVVEARSKADGIIEAVRWQGPSWLYAVQWHPEFHAVRENPKESVDTSFLNSQPLLHQFLSESNRIKKSS